MLGTGVGELVGAVIGSGVGELVGAGIGRSVGHAVGAGIGAGELVGKLVGGSYVASRKDHGAQNAQAVSLIP